MSGLPLSFAHVVPQNKIISDLLYNYETVAIEDPHIVGMLTNIFMSFMGIRNVCFLSSPANFTRDNK